MRNSPAAPTVRRRNASNRCWVQSCSSRNGWLHQHARRDSGFPRAPALLIGRLVSWVDDLWCRAIGAGV
nr:hypothetical protein [Mycobacterium pseudoshottsii]